MAHRPHDEIRQKFNKKMYIIGGVVVVIIIAVVVFLFIGGSSKKTEPKSTRPLRPSGHVGACAIVKMNDTDGVLMMQHNVSIIESELKKPNIEGLVYEYAAKMSVPQESAEEKDGTNFIAFVFPSTAKTSTIIYRFGSCSSGKTLPIVEHEFGAGNMPNREALEGVVPKAKQSGNFDCTLESLPIDGANQKVLTLTMLAEFDFLHKKFQVKKCASTYSSCATVYSIADSGLKPQENMPILIIPSWKEVKYFPHKGKPMDLAGYGSPLQDTPIKILRSEITDCIERYKEADGTTKAKIL
ncbi:uncharacterized protein LOC111262483 [Varroa jacobsoni]|uniref:Uncharacterized protein n=1 Tax=Varroa destructor TaxID=109461 RepID=A0A7M7K2K9_VARDE|nr:uncharacterized protein LOC111250085 isoform X2 [Varroa destructor]XP_022692514.1 uncharacterized protein LOC111262483 [Varroa jacobsoni]